MPQQEISKAQRARLQSWLRGLSKEELGDLEKWCRAEIAGQDDGVEGFAQFYRLVFGRRLPRHARRAQAFGLERHQ